MKQFGARVKSLREGLGLTRAQLAEMASMSRAYLYQVEDGTSQPSLHYALQLADALQVSIYTLVGRHGQPAAHGELPTFAMIRGEDETGVSGTGIVAHGAVFPNGKAVLAWTVEGKPQSIAVYDSIHDLFAVHVGPHGGKTQLHWLSLPTELEEWRGFAAK